MLRGFFTSLAFLSRLPVPQGWQIKIGGDFSVLPRYFWLCGLFLGAVNAAMALGFGWVLPASFAAALMAVVPFIITGAFHEDGFADVADAMGGYTVERRMEIMRDSRLGTFGTAAIATIFLLRFCGYGLLLDAGRWTLPVFLILIGGWMRWTSIVLLQLLPYVHHSGKGIAKGLRRVGWPWLVVGFILLGGLTALWNPLWLGAFLIAQLLTIGLGSVFFRRVFNGVNGDCLGAASITAELLSLLCLAALS